LLGAEPVATATSENSPIIPQPIATKDENLTASEMGNSPGVVVRHYRAVNKDAEAAEYWSIRPTNLGQA
jgi:hypothetical protein